MAKPLPPKKIKLAQVITRMDRGGAPDVVRTLCLGLDRERFELCLVTGETRYPTAQTKGFLAAFPGQVIVIDALRRDIGAIQDGRAFARLLRLFKDERFDVIHTHTSKAGALGRLAAARAGIHAVVHSPHGHIFYGYFNPLVSGIFRMAERRLAPLAARITVLSQREKDEMVKYRIAPPGMITVIGQGVDAGAVSARRVDGAGARTAFGIPETALVVGMAARLERVKGADVFMDAASVLAGTMKDVYFIVAGDGSLRRAMEGIALRCGIAGRFRFLGWRDDIPRVFSACDVSVLASLNEAAGISLIESQLLGCPVIATRVGGIPEVVREGETGLLIEPGNAEALREAIALMLRDRLMRERMSAAAVRWARGRFDARTMVDAYQDLYMDIAGALR